MLRGEVGRLRRQGLSHDGMKEAKELASVRTIRVVTEVEEDPIRSEYGQLGRVDADRNEQEGPVGERLALEYLVLTGHPFGVGGRRRPDEHSGVALAKPVLQDEDQLVAGGEGDLVEEHLESSLAQDVIQVQHPDAVHGPIGEKHMVSLVLTERSWLRREPCPLLRYGHPCSLRGHRVDPP